MEFVKKNALGILICLVIAVPAWLLGQRFEEIAVEMCLEYRWVRRIHKKCIGKMDILNKGYNK